MRRNSSITISWRLLETQVQSQCGRHWKHRRYWISISRTRLGICRVSLIKQRGSHTRNATSKLFRWMNSSNTSITTRKNRTSTCHNALLHRSSFAVLPLPRNLYDLISRWRRRMSMDISQNKHQLVINYRTLCRLEGNPRNNRSNSNINTRAPHQNLLSIKETKRRLSFLLAKPTTLHANSWTHTDWILSLASTLIESQNSSYLQKWG